MLSKHSKSEEFYESAIQKLTNELCELKNEKTPQKAENNPILRIFQELDDIKQRLSNIEANKK